MKQGKPEEVYVMDHSPEEWAADPKRRVEPWRGLTIFYTIQDIKEPLDNFYVQTPQGLVEIRGGQDDLEESKQVAREWKTAEKVKEVLLLRLKNSGKELDPRHFNQEERDKFEASDQKEWDSWLENQTVRILEPEKASKVKKSLIFQVPLRMIRTNKGKLVNGVVSELIAKSRLVAPGHMDPQLESFGQTVQLPSHWRWH